MLQLTNHMCDEIAWSLTKLMSNFSSPCNFQPHAPMLQCHCFLSLQIPCHHATCHFITGWVLLYSYKNYWFSKLYSSSVQFVWNFEILPLFVVFVFVLFLSYLLYIARILRQPCGLFIYFNSIYLLIKKTLLT